MRAWLALIRKEAQAIALPSAGAIAVMVAAGLVRNWRVLDAVALAAYLLAPIALGGLSIGHEFSHRTLDTQLMLPIRRRQLLAAKALVLSIVLATLGLAANWAADLRVGHLGYGAHLDASTHGPGVLLVPLACGFFLAPTFTLLARNALAGMIFTIAVPALFWGVGQVIAVSEPSGVRVSNPLLLALGVDWIRWGFVTLCAGSGLGLWLWFPRTQTVRPGEMRLLSRRGSVGAQPVGRAPWIAPRRRSVWWRLLGKELRLQQLTFVVSILYVIVCVPLAKLQGELPGLFADYAGGITYLYSLFVAMLTGALASAEERHFGTIEWQALQPMAAWRQWAIKMGVVFLLPIGLGLGVPWLLSDLVGSSTLILIGGRELPEFFATSVVLTIGSLYVSSLSASGVRALILCFPAFAGAALAAGFIVAASRAAASTIVDRFLVAWLPSPGADEIRALQAALVLGLLLSIALFLVWLVILAMRNHRAAAERAVVWRQVARVALVAASGVVIYTLLQTSLFAIRYEHILRSRVP